jgi:hypothetical protein
MGLLDDAIREHLELMRLRGADPTDIARAESEALGPVVREVAEPEHHAEDEDVLSGVEPAPAPQLDDDAEQSDELETDEEFEEEEFDAEEMEDDAFDEEPSDATQQFDSLAASADAVAEEEVLEEEAFDDPVLHSTDAAEAPSEGDVLEQTPEFLADSPDHDRLWFEQSGPRDFDFEDDK